MGGGFPMSLVEGLSLWPVAWSVVLSLWPFSEVWWALLASRSPWKLILMLLWKDSVTEFWRTISVFIV